MNPSLASILILMLVGSAVAEVNYCPPLELVFLLDQSENARHASSNTPLDANTKFNILDAQLRNIFSNPVLLRSPYVRVAAFGYSGSESLEIVPFWTYPDYAQNTLYKLRDLSNSGSWTYYGLRNINRRPSQSNNAVGVIFLISSQGSGSVRRRTLALEDAQRVRNLGWKIIVIEVVGNNPIDYQELMTIDQGNNTIYDGLTIPKSYRLLSDKVNGIINEICFDVYTTPTTTTTSTTTLRPVIITDRQPSICNNCMYEAGFSFVPDPEYCDTFYQCLPDAEPIKKLCPAGTFWDGNICNHRNAVQCPKAPCSAATEGKTYSSGRCCDKYFRCENGNLKEEDCPRDQFYDAYRGYCVTANKKSVCEDAGKFQCNGLSFPPRTFQECPGYSPDPYGYVCNYIFNGVNITTPLGTIWNQTICSLQNDEKNMCRKKTEDRIGESVTCGANFLATFNGGSKAVYSEIDGAFLDVHTIQQEVQLTGNALTFTSGMTDPFLYYYHFNNKDLNVNTGFRVRFNLQGTDIGRSYSILSNNFCSLCDETIKFTVVKTSAVTHVVSATFLTTENRAYTTSAVITKRNSNNWLEMIIIFGDDSIYGKVKEMTSLNVSEQEVSFARISKPAKVHIAMNKCGIQLGRGLQSPFVGQIDEFAEYERCKNIDDILLI